MSGGFLLDTNVPSELVRPQPEPRVEIWVAAQSLETLFISAVSFGEFRKGIVLRAPGKRRKELELWL
jgi:predicted nucleic acid-binding protein